MEILKQTFHSPLHIKSVAILCDGLCLDLPLSSIGVSPPFSCLLATVSCAYTAAAKMLTCWISHCWNGIKWINALAAVARWLPNTWFRCYWHQCWWWLMVEGSMGGVGVVMCWWCRWRTGTGNWWWHKARRGWGHIHSHCHCHGLLHSTYSLI